SISIQSEVAWRDALRALTEPAIWIAPENSSSFSVSVVLPASGWEMIAKVRRRRTCWASGVDSDMTGGEAFRPVRAPAPPAFEKPGLSRAIGFGAPMAHCADARAARHRGLHRSTARTDRGDGAAAGAAAEPVPAAHRGAADRRGRGPARR